MLGMQHDKFQGGFTLLELVMVILILALVAGSVIAVYGPAFIDDHNETATLFEMKQIRDAIARFKQDNPDFLLDATTRCTPADAAFLIRNQYASNPSGSPCVLDTDHKDWDPNYRLGWRGPYLSLPGISLTTINRSIQFDGTVTTGADQENITVITDPYGNPYYFFDLDDNTTGRIISFGADGTYDSTGAVTECPAASGDDFILCLR